MQISFLLIKYNMKRTIVYNYSAIEVYKLLLMAKDLMTEVSHEMLKWLIERHS